MDHFEHKIIQGEGAGKWLPFARTKVAALHARAKAMRVTALAQRWTVEGGDVEIAVRVVGDQRYIHIRRKQCPPFLSGLCDLVTFNSPVIAIPDPDDPSQTIQVLRRFYPSPATPAEDRAWRDEPNLAQDDDAGNQMLTLRSSMFSGEMRKVVQILQGANTFIPYSPTYALTHGVFQASTGQRWIIEISNQGVVAWPMQTCNQPIRGADGETLLDYTPIATPKPQQQPPQPGAPLVLLTADGVLDAYTKASFTSASGWAFSASGREAANVCVASELSAVGYLYKITINEVEGVPTTATMQEVEHGSISCEKTTCHMKYPIAPGNVQTYAFDTEGGPLNIINNAPVWCFYDGEALQVYRLIYNPGGNVRSGSEAVPCIAACPGILTGPNESGTPFITAGTETFTNVPHFQGPGTNPSIQQTTTFGATYRAHSWNGIVGMSPGAVGPHAMSANCNAGTPGDYIPIVQLGEVQYGLSGGQIARNVLVVPPFDREAVYIGGRSDGRGVERTSLSFKSFGAVLQAMNGCSIDTAPKVFRPTACCEAAPTFTVEGSFDEDLFDPTQIALCDNGTHPAAWFNFSPGVLGQVAYQLSATQTVGEQGQPSCACPELSCPGKFVIPFISGGESTPQGVLPLTTVLQYEGSGGVKRSFTELLSTDWYAGVFEFDTGQVIHSIRDAFDGRKYIISPDVGKLRGSECVTTADQYPVSEAGVHMAFVGVP